MKTSFLTNILGDFRILAVPELYHKLKKIQENNKVSLPKYEYPNNILTVSLNQAFLSRIEEWSAKIGLIRPPTKGCGGGRGGLRRKIKTREKQPLWCLEVP